MENNNVDNLISSLPEELQALATKCLEHIAQKKLEIDDAKLNLYINQDTLSRFLTAREGNETKALAMWEQWLEWRLTYKPENIQEPLVSQKSILTHNKSYLIRPPQWVQTDLRTFDMSVLGKFNIIMAGNVQN